MLRSAVDSASGDDGWSKLGAVGQQIGNQASFDSRNYGYRKLSDLIEATGVFEVRRDDKTVLVREKPKPSSGTRKTPAKKVPAKNRAAPPVIS